MTSRVLLLIAATAAFWLLTALPARYLYGDAEALFAGVAVLLCLVPAVLTLLWAGRSYRDDPQQATLTALGASGVRMFAVLIAAMLLYLKVPPFQGEASFLLWVAAAYLFTLAAEVVLLVRGAKAVGTKNPEDRGA